ncbi:type II CAAX prenyl endopeptidase Rce1 family protein [Singulisphaera sp. PoT]|uniref:CPBP family glutamic-type intramembrane protease n=1 Tax=Singulisphaera sp. PoT TaxID=3411797 RepID=UPI003BF5614F
MDTLTSEIASEDLSQPPKTPFAFADVPWRWSDILLGFAPLVLLRAISFFLRSEWIGGIPKWLWIPMTAANMIWLLAFPLIIAHRRLGMTPRFSQRPGFLAVGLEALIAMCSIPVMWMMLFACLMVVILVSGKAPSPELPLAPIAGSPNPWDRIALVVLAICTAPIAEECFFRGMLFNKFRRHMSPFFAVPLQGIIFGLVHPFGPLQIALISVIGMALGIAYLWRKTIITSMFMHAFQNSLAMALMLLFLNLVSHSPMIGVGGEAVEQGHLIQQLATDGPAARAGLKVGDIITTLDSRPVSDTGSIMQFLLLHKAGDSITVDYIRAGEKAQVEVILEKRQQE